MIKYHVTILSNFSRGYDKYSNCYSKNNIPVKFPDKFFLLDEEQLFIGLAKNRKLLNKNNDPDDKLLILKTDTLNVRITLIDL